MNNLSIYSFITLAKQCLEEEDAMDKRVVDARLREARIWLNIDQVPHHVDAVLWYLDKALLELRREEPVLGSTGTVLNSHVIGELHR